MFTFEQSAQAQIQVLVGNVAWIHCTGSLGIQNGIDVVARVDGNLVGLRFFIYKMAGIRSRAHISDIGYETVCVERIERDRVFHVVAWLEAYRGETLFSKEERKEWTRMLEKEKKEQEETKKATEDARRDARYQQYLDLKLEFEDG